jgi:hypothetical protein
MADEARVSAVLQILKRAGNNVVVIDYQSRPGAFVADVDGTGGPSPGLVLVSPYGTNIDLSQLITPGFFRVYNQSSLWAVEYGVWDPENLLFHPLLEVGPGESYVGKFSRFLAEEFGTGTGTGTLEVETNKLRFRALSSDGSSVPVVIEAFEA